ncbi:Testis-expressed protein 19 [Manis javanica]|nr:Testis-expressed protein 19 [Manis javanica]
MRTLGLGPEDADWTQGPPWRLGAPPACSHWPRPPPPWQWFLKVGLPPGEPMVLELGTTRAVDPTEAEAWLLDLQGVPVEGCYGATCLQPQLADRQVTAATRAPVERGFPGGIPARPPFTRSAWRSATVQRATLAGREQRGRRGEQAQRANAGSIHAVD